jgi:prepilin-type N-terminal cleavage/methylation domain-containing protein
MRPQRQAYNGFTLVELIVAMVISAMLMLCVYSFFRQVMESEARLSIESTQRATARSIADLLEQSLTTAIKVPPLASLEGGPNSDTKDYGVSLMCIAKRYPGTTELEWRSFRWADPQNGKAVSLRMKKLVYAGTRLISRPAGADDDDAARRLTPFVTVASGISELSLEYRSLGDPRGKWEDHCGGAVGNLAIRLHVRVGGATDDRMIVPPIQAALVNGGDK